MKEVKYDAVFSFIYSKRPGTPASEMQDDTSDQEKTDRMSRLLKLNRENVTAINAAYVGKTVRVLCEQEKDENGLFGGRTSGAKLVKFTSENENILGKFVDVKINDFGESLLRGAPAGESRGIQSKDKPQVSLK